MPSTTSDCELPKNLRTNGTFQIALGAIDGKHIIMDCPKNGGSTYYNYIGLTVLSYWQFLNANYCFTFADIGGFGSTNDASVLSNSVFGQALCHGWR